MRILYDHCLHLSISFLKKYQYLIPGQSKRGTVSWTRGEGENKEITAQIGILVHLGKEPYLELYYKQNGKPISYRVRLFSVTSNIGKGVVWFFVCPLTGNHCRKLYCVDDRFLHREAYQGCMYEKQTYSKRWRREKRIFDSMFTREDILSEIDKPYFRTEYSGKPTKRFQRMIKLAKKIKGITLSDLI
jgi:hypothetical protein